MKSSLQLIVPLLCLAGAAQAASPVKFSGFDNSLEGWASLPGQTTAISYAGSGGNTGGYVRNADQGSTAGDIIAPASWLGDWSGYNGGLLRWDFRIFSLGVNNGQVYPLMATLSGPGGTATFTGNVVPTVAAGWFTTAAPMQAANWTVTGGTWASVLGNVTEFKLQIETVFSTGFPGEVTGIDNVTLSPVPEPASGMLLALGGALLLFVRRRSRSLGISAPLMLAGLTATASATGATLGSDFNSGLNGWTGSGGTVTHVATGGNGGGYLRQTDTADTWMSVSAPALFLGNLTPYLGGTLSFDGKNLSNHASDLQSGPWFGRVVITGSGGSATRDVAGVGAGRPLVDGLWHSFSAALDPALWSGNLAAALANTTAITLTLEFNNAIVESAGLDNFQISSVPEPATALLLGAGALALLCGNRRRPYL